MGQAGLGRLCMPSLDMVRFGHALFASKLAAEHTQRSMSCQCRRTRRRLALMTGQSSMRIPNFNCQDVPPSPSLSFPLCVCACVCPTNMSNCSVYVGRLHVIKCKLQTNIAPIYPPPSSFTSSPSKQLQCVLGVICVRYLTCISNLAAALRGPATAYNNEFHALHL